MIENRPWGYFETLVATNDSKTKKLVVKPRQRLSLQKHLQRTEIWYVLKGRGKAILDEAGIEHPLKKGVVVYVPKELIHRIVNTSKKTDLVILEVQFGVCLEEDIIRIQDDYKRTQP